MQLGIAVTSLQAADRGKLGTHLNQWLPSVYFSGPALRTYLIVLGAGYLHTHRTCWGGLKLHLQAGKIFVCCIYCHWFLFHRRVRPGEVWFTDSQEDKINFRSTVLGLVFGFTGPEALGISVQNSMYVYSLGDFLWLCFYVWLLSLHIVLILESASPCGQ